MGPEVTKYLLDSNIIIYHLNGEKTATRFILENMGKCAVSHITYLEVLSFGFTNELFAVVKEFMDSFRAIDIDREITLQALENRNVKKIKVPDNIIASTAQVNNLVLVTRNVDDFSALDVDLLNIFD